MVEEKLETDALVRSTPARFGTPLLLALCFILTYKSRTTLAGCNVRFAHPGPTNELFFAHFCNINSRRG